MEPIQWLEENAEGFKELKEPERLAPMHFSLLWSYFEAEALRTYGSVSAITKFVQELHQQGKLKPEAFAEGLEYFKNRYHNGHGFASLKFGKSDNLELVEAVLSGKDKNSVNSVVALFIVIYRFRNNYFHGTKWALHLEGQLRNFTTANDSLIRLMSMMRAQ